MKGNFNRHEPYSLLGKKSNEQIFRRCTLKNKNTISLIFPYNKIFKGEKEKKKKKKEKKKRDDTREPVLRSLFEEDPPRPLGEGVSELIHKYTASKSQHC